MEFLANFSGETNINLWDIRLAAWWLKFSSWVQGPSFQFKSIASANSKTLKGFLKCTYYGHLLTCCTAHTIFPVVRLKLRDMAKNGRHCVPNRLTVWLVNWITKRYLLRRYLVILRKKSRVTWALPRIWEPFMALFCNHFNWSNWVKSSSSFVWHIM